MDQAKGLRNIVSNNANTRRKTTMALKQLPKVIAVTSGKGGVGKTNIVGNLAVALTKIGKKVVIIDADVGLANIDIIFNLRPKYSLRHVINSEKTLDQVMVTTDHGIQILPGGSGFADLTNLSEGEKLNLLSEFETLYDKADIIFVDTGAGISSNVLYFNSACDECIVVATQEPTSITDAYAMIKVMSQSYKTKYFKLIVNMVDSSEKAKKVYSLLSNALDKFLQSVVLEYLGYINFDKNLQIAVQKKKLIMDMDSEAESAKAIKIIAADLCNNLSSKEVSKGRLTFFANKIFHAAI